MVSATPVHRLYVNIRYSVLPALSPILRSHIPVRGERGCSAVEVDLPGGTEIIGGGAAMNSCNYGWFGTGALALLLRRLQFTRRRVTSRTRLGA